MVGKGYIFFLASILFFLEANGQNTFLEEINLLNLNRNRQLIYDSIDVDQNSYMIRSTSFYQNIQNQLDKKNNNFIKSLMFRYDFQNNSLLPQSTNDGILYPSRGWQERYSAGFAVQFGIIDLNYQPEKIIVQNLKQEPYYGNPNDGNFMFKYFGMIANNIDQFRQFGFEKIDTTSFGQSRIGIKLKNISFGYSSENLWWGPGKRNSLIFSNNAGGIKHYYLNSNNPIKTFFGNLEFNAILGTIDTTRYTDIDQNLLNACIPCKVYKNLDQRKINAITVNWQPIWLKNFYIGYAFSTQYYANQKNVYNQSFSFFSKDRIKQTLGSLMFRYIFPKEQAEFYGEIGLQNSAAYPWKFFKKDSKPGLNLGVSKIFRVNNKSSYFYFDFEITQLQIQDPRNIFNPGNPYAGGVIGSWYTNSSIRQGYSNNGQLLGSSIGPGSNSQSFTAIKYFKYFNIGVFVERISHNNDFYYSVYFSPNSNNGYAYYNRYWVDINSKLEFQFFPKPTIILSASFANTNAMNYRWIRYEDGSAYDEPSRLSDKFNRQFQLSIKYMLHAVIK